MGTAYAPAMCQISRTSHFISGKTLVNLMKKDPKYPYKGMSFFVGLRYLIF